MNIEVGTIEREGVPMRNMLAAGWEMDAEAFEGSRPLAGELGVEKAEGACKGVCKYGIVDVACVSIVDIPADGGRRLNAAQVLG